MVNENVAFLKASISQYASIIVTILTALYVRQSVHIFMHTLNVLMACTITQPFFLHTFYARPIHHNISSVHLTISIIRKLVRRREVFVECLFCILRCQTKRKKKAKPTADLLNHWKTLSFTWFHT